MDHHLMFTYAKYLRSVHDPNLEHGKLRFCDGSMQHYLESRWFDETVATQDVVFRLANTSSSRSIPSPSR